MIIVLNGPPGSGKDTIGKLLAEHCYELGSFKVPMWEIAKASLGDEQYDWFVKDYNNRETKEQPQEYLGGLSPRQFFIHISEVWCKPVFGHEYFGERMLGAIRQFESQSKYDVAITDGGFASELLPLLRAHRRVLIVRMHRKGFSFAGDSRDYFRDDAYDHLPSLLRPKFLDIELVDGDPEGAVSSILKAVK